MANNKHLQFWSVISYRQSTPPMHVPQVSTHRRGPTMQSENYKKRAGDVRRAARANLLEIRRARKARKTAVLQEHATNGAAENWHEDQQRPVADTLFDDGSDVWGALDEDQPAVAGAVAGGVLDTLDALAVRNAAITEITKPLVVEVDETSAATKPAIPEEQGADLTLNDAQPSLAEGCDKDAEGNDKPSTHDLGLDDPSMCDAEDLQERVGDDWSQSDLARLPGAGPGLVWMLEQCNIQTLADLAESDAMELSTQLGIVGQILDVGEWVRFAQENAPECASGRSSL
ncbi:hypothetical protein [Yoonia sp.]|uniref:hypothetical protein n=1 Tax=Yoonia sp. TaxID=2212373 RepID=UPI00358FAE04